MERVQIEMWSEPGSRGWRRSREQVCNGSCLKGCEAPGVCPGTSGNSILSPEGESKRNSMLGRGRDMSGKRKFLKKQVG